jgi:hypothetical protein
MKYDRFAIAPLNSGLVTNVKPWLAPEDAFVTANNAYIYEGVTRKRFGERPLYQGVATNLQQYSTRLMIYIGQLDATGVTAPPIDIPGANIRAGQMIGVVSLTGVVTTFIALAGGTFKAANPLYTGTYVGTTVTLNLSPAYANANVYFFPCDPVMGFATYKIGNINSNPTYAFDKQFAYQRVANHWERLGDGLWTGDNNNYFWSYSWHGDFDNVDLLFTTNNHDGIKYYDGVAGTWTDLGGAGLGGPVVNSNTNTRLKTAKIIIGFQGRLVALNTLETTGAADSRFVNRMRCSWPNQSPINVNAWDEYVPGRGFRFDAPTKEAIVTAGIIKNRLIVYFEKSTYELVYTNNEVIPFMWQQINSELGCQATFSQINFDDAMLAIGATGIHSCNGSSVARIDEKIHGEIARIYGDQTAFNKTYGVRDLQTEMIYWSFVDANNITEYDNQYPNRILAYNYRNGSWSFFDDCVTAFGYFAQTTSLTWDTITAIWDDYTALWTDDDLQSAPQRIIAGNQQGFTFIIENDLGKNSLALQISEIDSVNYRITSYAHNINYGTYVLIEHCLGQTFFNDKIYQVYPLSRDVLQIVLHPDDVVPNVVYRGNGTMTLVSRPLIQTKEFNFYVKNNVQVAISRADILVNRSDGGELTVQCLPSYSNLDLVQEGSYTNSSLGTQVVSLTPYDLSPMETYSRMLWRNLYLNTVGQSLQLVVTLSDAQMRDRGKALNFFDVHAFVFQCRPVGYDMISF